MANTNLRIKEVCKQKGLSLAELAVRLDIKPSSMSMKLYRGSFTIDKLGEIADVLGVTIPELFETYQAPSGNSASLSCPHCGNPLTISVSIG